MAMDWLCRRSETRYLVYVHSTSVTWWQVTSWKQRYSWVQLGSPIVWCKMWLVLSMQYRIGTTRRWQVWYALFG